VSGAFLALLIAVAIAAPDPVAATEFRYRALSRADLVTEFLGRRVDGLYADGSSFTEHFRDDGSTLYRDARGEVIGEMSFRDDNFCFRYEVPDMTGGCFVVWQRSANCYDFYVTRQGVPLASFTERILGVGWEARVWRTEVAATCPTAPVS